ncbi:hypothetical protein ANANG_G00114280 [Anguilla anguilla]|uniref:Uncharacterized protein n=1 Tax=Anguilla anguilla TaxID=7936 RepID=A0A9D3MCB1_ANGAN|nr:hypothetical protein ANANG_G00114280 [Anguilla anguilla]
MTPPQMTRMSGRLRLRSSLMSSGTRVLCPAARVLIPTQCTSASTACCATSRGVWEKGANVHVEPQVSEARGNDFGAPVVPVLSHLGH